MIDKFTLRDFLVYFVTGLFLSLILLHTFQTRLLDYFFVTPQIIKDYPTITIFMLIPSLYIAGQIIHGVDLLLFKLGRYAFDCKVLFVKKDRHGISKILLDIIVVTLNGYRSVGLLEMKKIDKDFFWAKVSKLQIEGKLNKAEYWYLMNDLFKGITLVCYFLVFFYMVNFSWLHLALSMLLAFISWYRVRIMAANFISSVNRTFYILSNN